MLLVPLTRTTARTSPLGRGIDRVVDDTLNRLLGMTTQNQDNTLSPALDVSESDKAYSVQLDLPGVRKEDIKIAVEGRRVRIEAPLPAAPAAEEGVRVIYRERTLANFARSFVLPVEIDQTSSQAKLEAGVLTLTLQKRQPTEASQLTVS
ncbi:Hsp20/alpha crystallin family protein [Ideonella azotifigens]|uniref:Hsp20/alpha crystallin family protein n=1 Tax=Ideonella azotifigens TaxID=513160 RepID=A0ABN1K4C1_9BURK|nr:Hsp20/alpha crystallin family protein [Ideonella azotifigens]MCD2344300.1 Hsp20/alpha crystallin family protein [Ideonella azotifigens]